MEVDYIIVGAGIAGCSLAMELTHRGSSVLLIDDEKPGTSSRIAAGLLNPIVPKRATLTWNAHDVFFNLANYYLAWEKILDTRFFYPMRMLQVHASEEEARVWKKNSGQPGNSDFIVVGDPSIPIGLPTPHGYCEVKYGGRLNVQTFCNAAIDFVQKNQHVLWESFLYSELKSGSRSGPNIQYKDVYARGIVFCEGVAVAQNPLFAHIPITPSWGDIAEITAERMLPGQTIYKQKQWVIPLENETYLVGSNFLIDEGTPEQQREEVDLMMKQLKKWFPVSQPIGYKRGARPVVIDRRPVLGEHPQFPGVFIFNGLGTKGCSFISWLGPEMAEHILFQKPLNEEIRVSRFFS